MDYVSLYQKLKMTPEEIAEQVAPGFACASPSALSVSKTIICAIAARAKRGELSGVTHHFTFPQSALPIFDDPELAGRYTPVLWFIGGVSRKAVLEGRAEIMPAYYKDFPELWRKKVPLDVLCVTVSPMDKHGYFSLGLTGGETLAQLERAKLVFAEVNPNMPRTVGGTLIHISQLNGLCESEEPLPCMPPQPETDDVSRKIGLMIAQEIPDGATLQLGVGTVPDVVGEALQDKRDLGIHSELFTDSMAKLIVCGAVTNSRKKLDRYRSVATFAFGTKKLYDFLDDNPAVMFKNVDYVNDPAIIAQNPKVISVNSCLEVDLYGQVSSETMNMRPYSGTGGQVDFVRGATASEGGCSYIAMPSTAKQGTISRISLYLKPGSVVTTSKNDVDCIVTEYGIARLRGRTLSQRAKELIAIAHPKFREELLWQAKKCNFVL